MASPPRRTVWDKLTRSCTGPGLATSALDESDFDDSEGGSTSTEPTEGELELSIVPPRKDGNYSPFLRRVAGRVFSMGCTPVATEKKKLVKPTRKRRASTASQSGIHMPTELLLRSLALKLVAHDSSITEDEVFGLSALLRRQLRHELQESTSWLNDAFEMLAPDSFRAQAPAGEENMQGLSDRFIDGLCALMQRANFRLFSQREWQFAQAEQFMFTLPVTVAWDSLDSSMISRLFVRHPHLGLLGAQLARRVLVFHRGSGLVTKTSFFLEEKLDMLLDKLVTLPFLRCARALFALLCPDRAAAAARARAELESEQAASAASMPQHAERINLERSLPTLTYVCRRIARRLTLQEPTFQEVVVVYAEIPDAGDADGGSDASRLWDGAADGLEPQPVLRLKSFRDIPIADVEVVLPGLRAGHLKSADVVKLAVILLAGIATAVYTFYFANHADWTVQMTLAGILLLRAFQTWRSVQLAKYTMDDFIRTTLYYRSQNSQARPDVGTCPDAASCALRRASAKPQSCRARCARARVSHFRAPAAPFSSRAGGGASAHCFLDRAARAPRGDLPLLLAPLPRV